MIVFFKPYDKQKEVLEALEDPAVENVVIRAGRRAGKTTIAKNVASKWCIDAPKDKPVKVLWIAPSETQAANVFKELLAVWNNKYLPDTKPKVPIIKKKKGMKGDTEIIFFNNSIIHFRSAGTGNNLRGGGYHYLVCDECAFVDRETLVNIIQPMLGTGGRKALYISTPKGKNFFYDFYNYGQTQDNWRSFHFTVHDNPFMKRSKIEEARLLMTDIGFQQEYLAEFVDNASAFKNVDSVCILSDSYKPIPGEKYYAGVDIGIGGIDYSVLSIIDSRGYLVKYYKWKDQLAKTITNNIIELNREWNFKKILFEINNNGLPMYQDLKEKLTNIEEFSTQKKSKSLIIEKLINLFDKMDIRCVDDSDFRMELLSYIREIKKSGDATYGAASGQHDDIIMATAIARYCYDKTRFNPASIGFY